MTAPLTTTYGPCAPWPVRWVCDATTASPEVTGWAVQFATEVAWSLSGRQFGLCEVTLRPCRDVPTPAPSSAVPWGMPFALPVLHAGAWYNFTCGVCGCGSSCACTSLAQVTLPAPTHSITQVKIDGSALPVTGYRLDDARTLVRVDGGEWPRCNDLRLDDAQAGTWSITARYGQDVPEGGAWAVGELACQFIRAIKGQDCRLPAQVTQLARQGVTINFPDLAELFKEGLTGLHLVDTFVRTWNPSKLRHRSRAYDVDGALHRRAGTG